MSNITGIANKLFFFVKGYLAVNLYKVINTCFVRKIAIQSK